MSASTPTQTPTLNLFCVFVPPLKPYGKYFGLIKETKAYLAE